MDGWRLGSKIKALSIHDDQYPSQSTTDLLGLYTTSPECNKQCSLYDYSTDELVGRKGSGNTAKSTRSDWFNLSNMKSWVNLNIGRKPNVH